MCQNTDYLREAVHLTDVDKFKSFHLIIKACIDQQQNLTHAYNTQIHIILTAIFQVRPALTDHPSESLSCTQREPFGIICTGFYRPDGLPLNQENNRT